MDEASNRYKKQLLLIFKIWFFYFVISKISLVFPHWKLSIFSHANYDLLLLILLLSFSVFKKEKHYPFVFLNLSILSFIYLTGHVVIFIGNDYAIGNDTILYILWSYRKILISIAICVTVIYLVTEILIQKKGTVTKYLLSFLCVIPVSLLFYHRFLIEWKTVFELSSQYQLLAKAIYMNLLALLSIAILGAYNLKRKKVPLQKHIVLLGVCLLIFLIIDIWDNYYALISKASPVASQIFLFLNLTFFCVILIDKLYFMQTEFGIFYDNYLTENLAYKLNLIPRTAKYEEIIKRFQSYIKVLPNRFFLFLLVIVSLTLFIIFFTDKYIKVSVLLLIAVLLILFLYAYLIVSKRSK